MKVVSLVGARPQFVKEALVGAAVRSLGAWEHVLAHSGQHYDAVMSDVFFQELEIPAPKYHLGVGSGSHAAMTGAALIKVEEVLLKEKPDALLVYGDTNTTLAGALAAAKLHIPVAHVEAGIRQEPKSMPEEINRVLTDHCSRVFCCCSQLAVDNLRRENISQGVFLCGDVMYDCYLRMLPKFDPEQACAQFAVKDNKFWLVTLHRDFNVDDPKTLSGLMQGLSLAAEQSGLPMLFFAHPRTQERLQKLGQGFSGLIRLLPPVGYLELMSLGLAARAVVTDSGGLQKEAYYASKRAVVVMPDTGWRELTESGWNILSAPAPEALGAACRAILEPCVHPGLLYGNGDAASLTVKAIAQSLARQE